MLVCKCTSFKTRSETHWLFLQTLEQSIMRRTEQKCSWETKYEGLLSSGTTVAHFLKKNHFIIHIAFKSDYIMRMLTAYVVYSQRSRVQQLLQRVAQSHVSELSYFAEEGDLINYSIYSVLHVGGGGTSNNLHQTLLASAQA